MKALKILLATGGSGGHIFPALVTADELKVRGHDVCVAGVFRKWQAGLAIQSAGFEFFEISALGFSTRSIGAFISFIVASLKSLSETRQILKKVKPDCVVGFGGYGSFPVVLAAALQGVPTMIQEQNVKPGKANKILSFFVKRIALGFSQAAKNFPKNKVVVTGCPIRHVVKSLHRSEILKQFSLPDNMPIILVLGGSQGSQRINCEFIKAATLLKTKIQFAVIHICGEKDALMCGKNYQSLGIVHRVFSFTQDIDQAYAVADCVVSRAGAMTVTELAAFALPAILIPYPHAGGHQRDNALVLTQTASSCLLEEKDLTSEQLADLILTMIKSKVSKEEISKSYTGIYHADAQKHLADEIEGLLK